MTRTRAAPSASLYFETINAYQRTAALKAALDLDFFTAIGSGLRTSDAIAVGCHSSVRGTRIVCDALVAFGFLHKVDQEYSLTADSAMFLNRRSPAFIGSSSDFLASPTIVENFSRLTQIARAGMESCESGALAAEHPQWIQFARAMGRLMTPAAERVADLLDLASLSPHEPWKMLDLAAGHGMFGVTIARRHANARIVAVDWGNVLTVALEHARAAGVDDRYETIAGDALSVEYGDGYDVVVIANLLHHFDHATCVTLLKKVHGALKPGARTAIVEFVTDASQTAPADTARFNLVMLATTPHGEAYMVHEYQRMLASAGLGRGEFYAIAGTEERVIISSKPAAGGNER